METMLADYCCIIPCLALHLLILCLIQRNIICYISRVLSVSYSYLTRFQNTNSLQSKIDSLSSIWSSSSVNFPHSRAPRGRSGSHTALIWSILFSRASSALDQVAAGTVLVSRPIGGGRRCRQWAHISHKCAIYNNKSLPAGLTRSMHLPKFNRAASRTTMILTSSLVTSLLRPCPCSKYLITPALISCPWAGKMRVPSKHTGKWENARRAAPCQYKAPPPKRLTSVLSRRGVGSCLFERT